MIIPTDGEVLNVVNSPNHAPWRTENDQLLITENGDFICFKINLRAWHTRSVFSKARKWLKK